jgi:Zn/Cd-binding protein ZinT
LTYYGVGTLAFIDGNMNSQKYIQTLDDNIWPVVTKHFVFFNKSHIFSIGLKSGD